jgi:hypothetical protein
MKKLLYLGIILMLGSCGSLESESTPSTVNVEVSVEIGNLQVMTEDFGAMRWHEAMEAHVIMGGWRLPTKGELNILYLNKDKIGGFANSFYWSSTEVDNNYAWFQNFSNGDQGTNSKGHASSVRHVRDF